MRYIFLLLFIFLVLPASSHYEARTSIIRPKPNNKSNVVRVSRFRRETIQKSENNRLPKQIKTRKATNLRQVRQTRTHFKNISNRFKTNAITRSAVNNNTEKYNIPNNINTKTGEAYEQCKEAYFSCMDQFCKMKNDEYRRCSCSDKVYNLSEIKQVLDDANDKLSIFNENLNTVGMTEKQVLAMKKASEGENALVDDTSASKSLLQAIMNSIKGEDKNSVGGKFSNLNSISISDASIGDMDQNQLISNFNGQNLYSAVFPRCRSAVRNDCNDKSLQRSITAYLMAIEQDCNTVKTSFDNRQKKMTNAVREGSAMLDLARTENRKKHNSDDLKTCVANIEKSILSEEVCGKNYKKCLDNGKYIDTSTGEPIFGSLEFNKLAENLTFDKNINIKISEISSNKGFIENFENRVKKYATSALDKCEDDSVFVWNEYLEKALSDIYYLQQEKVKEVKQTCFKYITKCYKNIGGGFDKFKQGLSKDGILNINPDEIALTGTMCERYINSCNNMFGGDDKDIITQYIKEAENVNINQACESIVNQCFINFGGHNFENFYKTRSNLISPNNAFDWFTVLEIKKNNNNYFCQKNKTNTNCIIEYEKYDDAYNLTINKENLEGKIKTEGIKSPCFKKIFDIKACKSKAIDIFGGVLKIKNFDENSTPLYLSLGNNKIDHISVKDDDIKKISYMYPKGVTGNILSQIYSFLNIDCKTKGGKFINRFLLDIQYKEDYKNCNIITDKSIAKSSVFSQYENNFIDNEYICPKDYSKEFDVNSYGICSCWENGGRRSGDGSYDKCLNKTLGINKFYEIQKEFSDFLLKICDRNYYKSNKDRKMYHKELNTEKNIQECIQDLNTYHFIYMNNIYKISDYIYDVMTNDLKPIIIKKSDEPYDTYYTDNQCNKEVKEFSHIINCGNKIDLSDENNELNKFIREKQKKYIEIYKQIIKYTTLKKILNFRSLDIGFKTVLNDLFRIFYYRSGNTPTLYEVYLQEKWEEYLNKNLFDPKLIIKKEWRDSNIINNKLNILKIKKEYHVFKSWDDTEKKTEYYLYDGSIPFDLIPEGDF